MFFGEEPQIPKNVHQVDTLVNTLLCWHQGLCHNNITQSIWCLSPCFYGLMSICHNCVSNIRISEHWKAPHSTLAPVPRGRSSRGSRGRQWSGDLVIFPISGCFWDVLSSSHWGTVWNVSITFSQFQHEKIVCSLPPPASDLCRRGRSKYWLEFLSGGDPSWASLPAPATSRLRMLCWRAGEGAGSRV